MKGVYGRDSLAACGCVACRRRASSALGDRDGASGAWGRDRPLGTGILLPLWGRASWPQLACGFVCSVSIPRSHLLVHPRWSHPQESSLRQESNDRRVALLVRVSMPLNANYAHPFVVTLWLRWTLDDIAAGRTMSPEVKICRTAHAAAHPNYRISR